jgi:heat shock protein HslJ
MLRSRPTIIAALLTIGLLVTGCGRGDDNANGGLANTEWTVIAIDGIATIVGAQPTMAFAPDGTLSGTSGCNQFSGRFRTDADRITVGQLSSTEMGCEADRMAQETAFSTALSAATQWRQTEAGQLELSGVVILLAVPSSRTEAPTPAVAPAGAWELVELGPTADLADLVPTIEFGPVGTVRGFAGCNRFDGTYTLDGATIAFGNLASTKMACERPAGAVEAEYLSALGGVSTWQIGADGRLLLGGPVPLTFTRSR